jgi:hypothetical protein
MNFGKRIALLLLNQSQYRSAPFRDLFGHPAGDVDAI